MGQAGQAAEAAEIRRAFGFGPAPDVATLAPRGGGPLRIVTLGEFRVEAAAGSIPDRAWGGRKPRLALLLLAASPAGLTRAELAEALGMEDAVPGAVHVLIGRVRAALGSRTAVASEGGRYRLVVAEAPWWDADRVERLAADLPGSAEEILDPYAGPFLPDLTEFHWVAARQARLHGIWLAAADAALAADRQAGDWPHALARAERILEIDPLAETAHRAVLEALWRTGRRSAAEAHFAAFDRRLRETLGTGPDVATMDFWRRLHRVITQ